MKTAGMIGVLTTLLVARVYAGQITTDQLIDGYITYEQKAGGAKWTDEKTKEVRQALQQTKDDGRVWAPYVFKGEKCDRVALVNSIGAGMRLWTASKVPLSKTAAFVCDAKNLESLSDAELVVALRLVEQMVEQFEKATTIAGTHYFRLGFGRMAEEGLHFKEWFELGSAVEGLGKEGDLIATVHGTKMGRVTSIFLVNVKKEKCLVVLPVGKSSNKASDATSEPAPGAGSSAHQR
jgi:hypothetical protein